MADLNHSAAVTPAVGIVATSMAGVEMKDFGVAMEKTIGCSKVAATMLWQYYAKTPVSYSESSHLIKRDNSGHKCLPFDEKGDLTSLRD